MSAGAGAFALFAVVWIGLLVITVGGFAVAVAALIDVARTPVEAFGPWWDNTRQTWLVGLAVSFVVPFGTIVAGALWFTSGRRGLRQRGAAGRPVWAGAPKPPPPWGGPAPGGYPPPGGPPPGWGPPPPAPPPGWGPPPPPPPSGSPSAWG